MTFRDFVFNALINKLLFGNQYIYANTDENTGRLWETCSQYYVLPAPAVRTDTMRRSIFSDPGSLVYYFTDFGKSMRIDGSLIYHLRDIPSFGVTQNSAVTGRSRLDSQKYPISNIIAVYEARNAIYVKRGALGLIVNQSNDVDGVVPLTPREKEVIREDFTETYGVDSGKSPVAIIDKPVSYIPIGMSIGDLQPFEECLLDAAAIAGAYGIDSNLIPRQNNPTYSNMNTAELNVYTSVVIPEVGSWLDGFNRFLGLYDEGYYIDALWDGISILQENIQRRETAKSSISNRCRQEFNAGLITLNDWRVAIGRERKEDPIYNKTLLEMTQEEIDTIKSKIQ